MDKGIVITKEMLKKGEALEATKSKTNSTSYDAIFLNGKERKVTKKSPAEVLNWRTETSKTFWLGKDNFKLVTKMHPIHYKGNDGTWNDLDPTIVKGVVTKSPYYARILKNKIGYVGTVNDGKKIELELINAKFVEPIIEKNKVTYKNIAKDTDLEIKFGVGRIQANKILHSKNGEKKSVFRSYREKGIKGKLLNLGWDKEGKNTKLYITEEKTNRDDEKLITQTFDGKVMRMNPVTRKREWSDDVKYPVIIDPTTTTGNIATGADDGRAFGLTKPTTTGVYASPSLNTTATNPNLKTYPVGSDLNVVRSAWLLFSGITIPKGSSITSATLAVNGLHGAPGTDTANFALKKSQSPVNPTNTTTDVTSVLRNINVYTPVAESFTHTDSYNWIPHDVDVTTSVQSLVTAYDYSGGTMLVYAQGPPTYSVELALTGSVPGPATLTIIYTGAAPASRRRIIIAC